MTPLKLMACAIDRTTTSGKVLGPDQRIDIETALRTHTIDAAWQMRVDHLMGSIEPGKLADFVIFDREPDARNLETLQVVATIVGDKPVYPGAAT
jgi:predicted amidohydrolase YtcJ